MHGVAKEEVEEDQIINQTQCSYCHRTNHSVDECYS